MQHYLFILIYLIFIQYNSLFIQNNLEFLKMNPKNKLSNSSKPDTSPDSKPKHAHSELAKRLFRNSSTNHINPHLSLLSSLPNNDSSEMLNKSWNSQLIPSISLQKLKKKQRSEKYLEFNRGKILVNPHHSYFETITSKENKVSNRKFMFKKLEKLSYSPTSSMNNKILPDDLIDYPIENDLDAVVKIPVKNQSLFRSKHSKNQIKKIDSLQEENEDLFPEDFMQLLRQDNLVNQFCYLKKMEHPYDLKIIEFDKNFEKKQEDTPSHYPSQYITISSRGITYFSPENSRFVPLQEWKRQAEYFKKIIKLDFFKNFKVIKNFGSWKKYIRKSAMNSTIDQLKDKLVYGDRHLRESILETRNSCVRLESDISYIKLDDSGPMSYRQFKLTQQNFIQADFLQKLMDVEEEIKEKIIVNMAQSMKQFKEQNKISSSVQGKGMPLLIGDEKNLEMPYTKEATLRAQQQKFKRFVKLIDLMITHSKVNMMDESTKKLCAKLDEQNDAYDKQSIGPESSYQFKGKQYITCQMGLDPRDHHLIIKPNREEMNILFQEIVNKTVVRLCRNHKKMLLDTDVLSVIYDDIENAPKDAEGDMLKAIMTSDQRQESMLSQIMRSINRSFDYIINYASSFEQIASINFKNLEHLKQIDTYCAKDHEKILEFWQKELATLGAIKEYRDSAVIMLDLKEFKSKALSVTNTCINKAKQLIPKVFDGQIASLAKRISLALQQMENEPLGVQSYITFHNNKNLILEDIENYSDLMMEINCFDILVKNMIKTSETVIKNRDKQIKELQIKLNSLRKKLEQTDINNQLYEKRAQEQVKTMEPKNRAKITELYTKINSFVIEEKQTKTMNTFISKRKKELEEIVIESENIREYQNFLKLEETQETQLANFKQFFEIFEKIWELQLEYEQYEQKILEECWENIIPDEIFMKIQEFITNSVSLQRRANLIKEKDSLFQFSNYDLKIIKNLLVSIEKLRPPIQVIESLKDKAFEDKKDLTKNINLPEEKQMLRTIEGLKPETTVQQLRESNITSQISLIKGMVSKAKRYNDVTNKSKAIEQFIRHNISIMRILADRNGFNCEKFLKQLDEKLLMANLEYKDIQKTKKDKDGRHTLQKLRQILLLWQQHEKHTQFFQQMQKIPEWRTSKEGKHYITCEQNWKKNIKQYKDAQLGKINANEKLFLSSLRECNEQIQGLYPFVQYFLNTKRYQSPRLAFLTDEEILKIYRENKDYRSFSEHVRKLFPHVQKLTVKDDELLPTQAISISGETLIFKPNRNSSLEVDEMIKVIQQCIKSSLKLSFRNCSQAFDSEEFNKNAWIEQYPLQTLIFINEVYLTKIIQQDYLIQNGEDLNRLLSYHESQSQKLINDLRQKVNALTLKKTEILITQSLQTRDKIAHLVDKNVTSVQDYEWIRQIRYYYHMDTPTVQYVTYPVTYGFEFVSLFDNPLIQSSLNERLIIETVNYLWLCGSLPFSSSSILQQIALFNGKNYQKLELSTSNQRNVLYNYMIGAYLNGSLVDIHMPYQLQTEKISYIASVFKEIQTALSHKQAYFRGFKNIPLHRQSALYLVLPEKKSLPELPVALKSIFRKIEIPQLPYKKIFTALLQIHETYGNDFWIKIGNILDYLRNTFDQNLLTFSEISKIVEQNTRPDKSILNFESGPEKKLAKSIRNSLKKKLKTDQDRKFVDWVFKEAFQIINFDKSAISSKSFGEVNPFDFLGQGIAKNLHQSNLCLIYGRNSLVNLGLAEKITRKIQFSERRGNFYEISDQNIGSLFGQYHAGRWQQGVIITEMKKDEATHNNNNKKCVVLIGQISEKIINLLSKLSKSLTLDNGQVFQPKKTQKFIFVHNGQYIEEKELSNIRVFSTEGIKMQGQNIFDQEVLALDMIKVFGASLQLNFSSFKNLLLNSCQKINSSNLKILGHTNQFIKPELVIKRCIQILNAAFSADSSKCCQKNLKIMEKSIFWSLFWAIGSSMPKTNMERLEKLMHELIKIDYDKAQFLGETKFAVSERNQTVSKAIKTSGVALIKNSSNININETLEAKIQLIKLLIKIKAPIYLIGQHGAGKSLLLDYLRHSFTDEDFCTIKINLNRNTTLEQFLKKLSQKTLLKTTNRPESPQTYYKCLDCYNGKQLIVLIDNLNYIQGNSQLYRFLSSCIGYRYFIDEENNKKIELGNISFICAENSTYSSLEKPFITNCFIPIQVSSPEVRQILASYLQNSPSTNNQDFLAKISDSIISLDNYIYNLPSENSNIVLPSRNTIAKQIITNLISFCEKKAQSQSNIIGLWKYLTVKKYVDSGLKSEYKAEILKEITSLINLISKNAAFTSETILEANFKEIISQFEIQNEICAVDSYFRDYFQYLCYLIENQSGMHLLRLHELIPAPIKTKLLSKICHEKSIGFMEIKHEMDLHFLEEIKQQTILYIDERALKGNTQWIQTILEFMIEDSDKGKQSNVMIVMDLQDEQKYTQYLKYYPEIYEIAAIYTPKSTPNYKIFPFYSLVHDNQKISWQIYIKQQKYFNKLQQNIKKQHQAFKTGHKNYLSMRENLKKIQNEATSLNKEIQDLSERENQLISEKNQLVDKLKALLSLESTPEIIQQKQVINKKINSLDIEINSAKRSKIDKKAILEKIQESEQEQKVIQSKLSSYEQMGYEKLTFFTKALENFNAVVVILGYIELYYENRKMKTYKQKAEQVSQNIFSENIEKFLSMLYQCQVQDIEEEQWLVLYLNRNKQAAFVTEFPDNLIEKLLSKISNLKYCKNQYELGEQSDKNSSIITKNIEVDGIAEASVIKNMLQIPEINNFSQKTIKYIPGAKERLQKFKMHMYQLLHPEKYFEILSNKDQIRYFKLQINKYWAKIKSKFSSKDFQISNRVSLGQVKQYVDIVSNSRQKVKESYKKITEIEKEYENNFEIIKKDCIYLYELFVYLREKAEYFEFEIKDLIILIKKSIEEEKQSKEQELKKQKEAEANKDEQVESAQKENNEHNKKLSEEAYRQIVNNSGKTLYRNINRWLEFSLKPNEHILAYFLIAIIRLTKINKVSHCQYQQILKLCFEKLEKQQETVEINIKIENDPELKTIIEQMNKNNVFSDILMEKIMKYGSKYLGFDLMEGSLRKKYWKNGLPQLIHIQETRYFVAYGNSDTDYSKLIDRQIGKSITPEQSVLVLEQSEYGLNPNDIYEKLITPPNQTWLIIPNWKNIQNIFCLLNFTQKNPSLNCVLYYDECFVQFVREKILSKMKYLTREQKSQFKFCQLWLYDKSDCLRTQIQRLLNKYFRINHQPEISKILRLHCLETISRLVRSTFCKDVQVSNYQYRFFQYLMKKYPGMTTEGIVFMLLDFFYDPKRPMDRSFLKQIKKITKMHHILPQFAQETHSSKNEHLLLKNIEEIDIQSVFKLKQHLIQYVPEEVVSSINISISHQKICSQKSEIRNSNNSQIDRKQLIEILNQIFNRIQTANQIQEAEATKLSLSLAVAKEEKSQIEKEIKKKLDRFRYLLKIIENPRSLRPQIESQLAKIKRNGSDLIVRQFNNLENRKAQINKQITKGNTKSENQGSFINSLSVLRKNYHKYLYIFMLQNHINSSSLPLQKNRIPSIINSKNEHKAQWWTVLNPFPVGKCLLQKEKEAYKLQIQSGEIVSLKNMEIFNADFDSHKLILDNNQNKGDGTLLTNIYLHVMREQETSQYRRIPWMIGSQKLAQIYILGKVKQSSVWWPGPFIHQK